METQLRRTREEIIAAHSKFDLLVNELVAKTNNPEKLPQAILNWCQDHNLPEFNHQDKKPFQDTLFNFASHPRQIYHITELLTGGRFSHPLLAKESIHIIDGYQFAFHKLNRQKEAGNLPKMNVDRSKFYLIPQSEDLVINGINYPRVIIGLSPDGRPVNESELGKPAAVARITAHVDDEQVPYVGISPDWVYNLLIDSDGRSRSTTVVFMNQEGASFKGSLRYKFNVPGEKPRTGIITDTLMY